MLLSVQLPFPYLLSCAFVQVNVQVNCKDCTSKNTTVQILLWHLLRKALFILYFAASRSEAICATPPPRISLPGDVCM